MPDNPHQFCEGRVLRCDAVDVIDHMRAVNGVKTVVCERQRTNIGIQESCRRG